MVEASLIAYYQTGPCLTLQHSNMWCSWGVWWGTLSELRIALRSPTSQSIKGLDWLQHIHCLVVSPLSIILLWIRYYCLYLQRNEGRKQMYTWNYSKIQYINSDWTSKRGPLRPWWWPFDSHCSMAKWWYISGCLSCICVIYWRTSWSSCNCRIWRYWQQHLYKGGQTTTTCCSGNLSSYSVWTEYYGKHTKEALSCQQWKQILIDIKVDGWARQGGNQL